MTRDGVLALMIAALASDKPRQFHVGIVGYFLDGSRTRQTAWPFPEIKRRTRSRLTTALPATPSSRRVCSMPRASRHEVSSPCRKGLKPCPPPADASEVPNVDAQLPP